MQHISFQWPKAFRDTIIILSHMAGETIPASDSDEETRGSDALEGIYRQRERCVIAEILQQFGSSKAVLQSLSDELQLSLGKVTNA